MRFIPKEKYSIINELSKILKQNRIEAPDEHEQDENHLKSAERAYLEIAN